MTYHCYFMQTNWTLRSLVHGWAQEHGIPVPDLNANIPQPSRAIGPPSPCPASTSLGGGPQTHPIISNSSDQALGAAASSSSTPAQPLAIPVPETWTFFQGFDSPGGDLFRLQCDHASGLPPMLQLLGAADKVPNCIAFNSSGHLKAALQPR